MFFVDNFDKPSWPEGTTPEGIEGIWLGHPVKCSWCVIHTPWWGSVQLVIRLGMTGNVNSNHGRADATFALTFCTFTFRYLGGFSFLHKQPSRCSPCHACYANKNQQFCAKSSWIETTEKQAKKLMSNICIGKVYIFKKSQYWDYCWCYGLLCWPALSPGPWLALCTHLLLLVRQCSALGIWDILFLCFCSICTSGLMVCH